MYGQGGVCRSFEWFVSMPYIKSSPLFQDGSWDFPGRGFRKMSALKKIVPEPIQDLRM